MKNNILEGKYILLENKDFRKIITILYNNGYYWKDYYDTYGRDDMINYMINYYDVASITCDGYILIGYSNFDVLDYKEFINKEQLYVENLFREEKLKRILK